MIISWCNSYTNHGKYVLNCTNFAFYYLLLATIIPITVSITYLASKQSFVYLPSFKNSAICTCGVWTIRTLDDSDLVNSDHILANSDLFTGQFGPHTIRSELTKRQIALRSELTNDQAAIRSELTKTQLELRSELTNV